MMDFFVVKQRVSAMALQEIVRVGVHWGSSGANYDIGGHLVARAMGVYGLGSLKLMRDYKQDKCKIMVWLCVCMCACKQHSCMMKCILEEYL